MLARLLGPSARVVGGGLLRDCRARVVVVGALRGLKEAASSRGVCGCGAPARWRRRALASGSRGRATLRLPLACASAGALQDEAEGVRVAVGESGAAVVTLLRATAPCGASAHALRPGALLRAVEALLADESVHSVVLDLSSRESLYLADHATLAAAVKEVREGTGAAREQAAPPQRAASLLSAEAALAARWAALCEAKLVVAVLGDVVGSAGVALALPCTYRVAARSTVCQVADVTLGLPVRMGFASHAVKQMGAHWALYLALTALPLPLRPASDNTAGEAAPADPADLLAAGVATHLVSDEQIAELLTELLPAAAEPDDVLATLDALDALVGKADASGAAESAAGRMDAMLQECLNTLPSLEAIEAAVQERADCGDARAAELLAALRAQPPAAVVGMFAHIRGVEGAQRLAQRSPPWPPAAPASLVTLDSALDVEYRMAARLILREDFHEGVEGMGAPGSREWLPSTLAAANAAPEVLKLTAAEELAFERRTPEEVAAEYEASRRPGTPFVASAARRDRVRQLVQQLEEAGVALEQHMPPAESTWQVERKPTE